jgi:hypothetical protein
VGKLQTVAFLKAVPGNLGLYGQKLKWVLPEAQKRLCNRRQITPQGQLVAGEQRPAGDGKVLLAALAAEAERVIRAAGLLGIDRSGMRILHGSS